MTIKLALLEYVFICVVESRLHWISRVESQLYSGEEILLKPCFLDKLYQMIIILISLCIR